ncbi:MAG: hypothetical protein GVY16_02680 [Planctomycetes bacterium]|jgi:hypothetical protein|nr:hypothetical protein [Phycisphaerae bacterium]NBB94624.1 hypothetical protein [Planctomycetota bacterium]
MPRRLLSNLLTALAVMLGGCVTAHEGSVNVRGVDHLDQREMPDLLVLTIASRSVEPSGHWWIAEREAGAALVPRSADVLLLRPDETLHQEGTNVALFGPYAYGRTGSWEYWVFRPGYDPQRFYDAHFEHAYKREKPLTVTLSRFTPGSAYSDEKVLDAARRVASVGDMLPANDPPTGAMLRMLSRQLRRVRDATWTMEERDEADNLLTAIARLQERCPPPQHALLSPLPDAPPETVATGEAETPSPAGGASPQITPAQPVSLDALGPVPPDIPEGPVPIKLDSPPARDEPTPDDHGPSAEPNDAAAPPDETDTVRPRLAEPN